MGLFDRIFSKKSTIKNNEEFFKILTGYAPVFTSWRGQLYESELVRSAINARANNISKLNVTFSGSAEPKLITKMKRKPNSFQTWSQFLYRLSTILDCQNTAFIVPVIDEYGQTTGIYCVLPSRCELIEYNSEVYLRYTFSNGDTAAIELNQCGILTKFQYQNDFFGESNNSLSPTLSLVDMQNQGITEAVKSGATYRFMATANNFTFGEDLAKERKRFSRENFEGDGSGLLLFPNTYSNIQQINSKPYVVDAETMNYIKHNVFNYFGVNEDILQNKAFGDSWSAFYEGAIEPFAIQLSEVLKNMLFTAKEQASGANIMFTSNRLQFMTNKEKLDTVTQLIDRGLISLNDGREIYNLPPVEGGDVRIIRGEYYNAANKIEGDQNNE